jgi:hypothetical protein
MFLGKRNTFLRRIKMPRYQVVIERCVVYELDAYDEKDAEDLAWGMFNPDDLNDPFVAETLMIEENTNA